MLMNSIKSKSLSLVLLSLIPFYAHADNRWDDANDPNNFDVTYVKDFNQLPLKGEMDPASKRGWADSYWPKVRGSIADRWQVKGSKYKKDKSPGYYQLMHMSESEINLLSPAEKFDLARGKLDFPVASEIRKEFREKEKDWRGICNGWTHASLNYAEPNPVVYIDPKSNRKIPFGSSDIKGLLAYFHAVYDDSGAKFIGRSCRPSNRLFNIGGACTDVHPAAMHIMMSNELGIRHQGFAADRDSSVQVWNQPFVKFESRIDDIKTRSKELTKRASEGTRKQIYITSVLTYVNELYDSEDPMDENSEHVAPSYTPVLGTEKQRYKTVEYKYILDLNIRDRIIGGEWISEERPDLLWKQDFQLPGKFTDEGKKDDWSLLSEIVKMATEAVPSANP